jgi:hypothetical protein
MKTPGSAMLYTSFTATLLAMPSCGSKSNSDTYVAIDASSMARSRDAGGSCLSSRISVSLNEVTPLGYAPSDVMALLGPTRTAELHYRDVAGDGLARFPGTATSTIHVTSEFDPSRSFFVDLSSDPNNPPPPSVLCEDYLLLGVRLTLTSDDGAFDEILTTEFYTKQLPDRLNSWVGIPANDKRGTFALSTVGANDGDRFTYSVRQTFLAGAWLGRVDANYDAVGRPAVFTDSPFAEWGSAPCEAGSTPIVEDGTAYAKLAAQAISTITSVPVPLAFSDGTRTVARLSYPPSPIACRVEDRQFLQEPEGTILLPSPITVTTDDGRWSGTLGTTGVGHVATGTLSSLRVYYNAPDLQTLPPDEFTTFYGFSGVDFTNYARARLGFLVDYDVASQRVVAGTFEIWGVFSNTSTRGSTILGATVGGGPERDGGVPDQVVR